VGLLTSVGANVAGLVLEAEEGFVAQMALIGTRRLHILIGF
jgi:hypothetical protein